MFQYFPYGMVDVTWEDKEAAQLPSASSWQSWELVSMPSDNTATGGLLELERPAAGDAAEADQLLPSWSEAWVCRNFTLPEDFTSDENVTLLLGIIDDLDVVYINGHLVAGSGFKDGNGSKTLNISPTGGFDYSADTPAENKVMFEKSYWEVQREYSIPSKYLNQGGTNEICIRLYNNNGYGGFYSGNNYAICGNDMAVRALKGLPVNKTESEALNNVVEKQKAALAAGDIEAYAATISEDYHNDADSKADKVAEIQAMMDQYSNISVTDEQTAVYTDDEGNYWYSALRTIKGVRRDQSESPENDISFAPGGVETIQSGSVEICYAVVGGNALERGNWSRCYSTSYDSGLFGKKLTYSIYLPTDY